MIRSNGRTSFLRQKMMGRLLLHCRRRASFPKVSSCAPLTHPPTRTQRRPAPSQIEVCRTKPPPTFRRPESVRPLQRFLNNEVHSAVQFAAVSGLPHPLSAHPRSPTFSATTGHTSTPTELIFPWCLRMICSNAIHPFTQLQTPIVPASVPTSFASSSPGGQQPGNLAQHAVTSAMASSMYSSTVEAAHLPMNWIIQTDQPCRAYRLAPDRRGLCPVCLSFCDVTTPQTSTSWALAAREPSDLGKSGLVPPSSFSSHPKSKRNRET